VEILELILQIILAITSVILVIFVLMHKGRGGGLSDMFGGGVSSALGSSGVAERNLNRYTLVTALVWAFCIVVLALITKFSA